MAFLKLAGRMSSRPLMLPGRHLINSSLLGMNVATMAAFITYAPTVPAVAAAYLGANTVLSFIKGFTTTAAIGGADMRESCRLHVLLVLFTSFFSRCHYRSECILWICPGGGGFHAG